ncbi:HAD family hydrolase [Synechococcus sp. PCC 7336]|uniref:HAD family hydrolase n=1 Tax=Synechococcus sp. PCC 7336 TaxID=195250 RepID=UPI00034A75B5|nr:HAD family hydrolase [Synechococcus sp. PCC 7336]
MQYWAIACDYDGTLATDGKVDNSTILAIECLRQSGRRAILATGRQLDDLQQVFPQIDRFDRVVAENGGLLYNPATGEQMLLGSPPPADLIEQLRLRNVNPLSVGRSLVATWQPHAMDAHVAIRHLNLNWQVICNKQAVMLLPFGIDKGSGLQAALADLQLSAASTIGIGDAENDCDLLVTCGYAVAVGNALPVVKTLADWITVGEQGAGVREAIDRLLEFETL